MTQEIDGVTVMALVVELPHLITRILSSMKPKKQNPLLGLGGRS